MGLLSFIDQLLGIYIYIIIIRAIMSWFMPSYNNPVYRVVITLTEPVLRHIRRLLPDMGGFDVSPILLILLIGMIRNYILS